MHVPQLLVGLIVEPQLTLDVGGHVGVIAVPPVHAPLQSYVVPV